MEIERIGVESLVIRGLPESPITAAAKFRKFLRNLLDVVPCYETVGLYFSGKAPDESALLEALRYAVDLPDPKSHRIPVCYEFGVDLESVSLELGLTPEELIALHTLPDYRCAAVGFIAGFAYLGDLDPRISTMGRRATPRTRVEAGSLGITGRQTAVYPTATPGGWHLIGKSPYDFVNLEEEYFPISAGDYVKFFAIDKVEYEYLRGKRF